MSKWGINKLDNSVKELVISLTREEAYKLILNLTESLMDKDGFHIPGRIAAVFEVRASEFDDPENQPRKTKLIIGIGKENE